ncbi:amidohydrolase [Alloalcanivorax mobilis]|uniref:amidohydrolase n=1 Tax=Alloalcanivorax mobilis TaxID=2019569 RepID=UPI000C78D197|nr:amidohydrolase [Alloalcanivorax mobilis]
MNRCSDLKLALVQTSLYWEQRDANLAHLEQRLEQCQGAHLIVLPEMFTTGFSMTPAGVAEPADGPTLAWLRTQAARLQTVITGSVMVRTDGGGYRNRLFWVGGDQHAHYDKRHLFRMAGEHQRYQAGERALTVTLNGWRVRPLICYDLRFPVWSRDARNTDLLLYVANWPAPRRLHWNRLLAARAIENQCYVAAVNRIGEDGNGHPYSGDSRALDFNGEVLADAGDRDQVMHVTLNQAALADYREAFPAWQDADRFTLELP